MDRLEPDYKNMKTPLPTAGEMLVEGFLELSGIIICAGFLGAGLLA